MALQVNINSYVDVAEADTYFSTRYGSGSWDLLDPASKESALISATSLVDKYCVWSGAKTDPAQPLEFPRNGDTEVPQAIKDAQCELTLSVIAAGTVVAETEAPLKSLKAGDVTLVWNDSYLSTNSMYNSYVRSFLDGYCDPTASSGSSTARVIRT